jgi:signal peptidase II
MSLRAGSALAAILALAVIGVDQLAKALVRGGLYRGERREVLPFLDVVNTRNSGVAFGVASGGGVLVAVGGGLALVILLVFFARHAGRPLAWLPTGLLIGGACGNLIDRIAEGSVTDWIQLPHFWTFNLADTAITFGVIALVYVLEGPPRVAEERRRAAQRSPADWPPGAWPPSQRTESM